MSERGEIVVIPIRGVPEIHAGDDVAAELVRVGPPLQTQDIVVVAHKVVSKAEGRFVAAARRSAVAVGEAARILRRRGDLIIAETRHGFVCANAGVDASNVPGDNLVLLPIDPDLSARRIRKRIAHLAGVDVGVIISDTFGRAWRTGQTNVAIGVAGIEPFIDHRGKSDTHGKLLSATRIAVADELAGAAELVMGKTDRICAAIVRDARVVFGRGTAAELLRPSDEDLFR